MEENECIYLRKKTKMLRKEKKNSIYYKKDEETEGKHVRFIYL